MKSFDEAAAVAVVRQLTAEGRPEARIAQAIGRSRYFLTSLRSRYAVPKHRPVREVKQVQTPLGVPSRVGAEIRGLLPLLGRKSENVARLRELIAISKSEEAVMIKEIGPMAKLFVDYRKKVLQAFDTMVKARGIAP